MHRQITIYNSILAALGAVSLILLVWVIQNLNPEIILSLIIFYLSTALLAFCLTSIFGFYLRQFFGQRELASTHFGTSVRQAILFSVLIIVSLMLKAQNWFNAINVSLLLLSLIFLEGYFLSTKQNNQE